MILTVKKLIVSGLIFLGLGFLVGRYTVPEKVVTKTEVKTEVKTVVKWKTKLVKDTQKNKQTVIIETRLPDGTVKKETTILDKGTIKIDKSKDTEKQSSESKSETKEKTVQNLNKDWKLSAVILADPKFGSFAENTVVYGVLLERRILGPFYVGGMVTTNRALALTIGAVF